MTHMGNENIAPTCEDSSNGDEPMGLSPTEESSSTDSDGLQSKACKIPKKKKKKNKKKKKKEEGSKTRSNLPKWVVDSLLEWLRRNRYNAYPSEETKQHMARTMGITVKQVNNWFINARRRKLDGLLSFEGKCACDYRITRKKRACPVNHQARRTAVSGNASFQTGNASTTPSRPIQTPPTPCGSTSSSSAYDSSTEESIFEFRPISPKERTLDFESL